MEGTVYLICLASKLGHAKHYIGWSLNPEGRLFFHRKGKGSKFLKACNEQHINYDIVRTWPGDRNLERRLKNRKKSSQLCPICQAKHKDISRIN